MTTVSIPQVDNTAAVNTNLLVMLLDPATNLPIAQRLSDILASAPDLRVVSVIDYTDASPSPVTAGQFIQLPSGAAFSSSFTTTDDNKYFVVMLKIGEGTNDTAHTRWSMPLYIPVGQWRLLPQTPADATWGSVSGWSFLAFDSGTGVTQTAIANGILGKGTNDRLGIILNTASSVYQVSAYLYG